MDGARQPQLYGTGTEDYFNEAWGLRVSFSPWYGTPVAEGERVGARLTGYRWHVPDPIPFTKSLWAGIEHTGWTYNHDGSLRSASEERPDYFSSTAFWYQTGVNEDLAEPPYGEERLPLGNAQQIAVEDSLAEVTTEKGKASVQREVDWGKDLLFFEAEGTGSRINIPLDIPEKGRYEIVARIAQAPDYGDYYALLDGKPTNLDNRSAETSEIPQAGAEVFHNFLSEIYVAVDRPLGWLNLEKGRHTLSFVCAGRDGRSSGYNLGINDVVLERVPVNSTGAVRERATAARSTGILYRGLSLATYVQQLKTAKPAHRADRVRALGAFGPDARPAVNELVEALKDSDASVRESAAWSLSQMGEAGMAAVSALAASLSDPNPRVRCLSAVALRSIGSKTVDAVPALIKALTDSEAYVRAPAADALRSIGPAAKDAVIPLSDRLTAKVEQVYVMRSVSYALGSIGPQAAAALPALQEALKIPRVRDAAREAIMRINKEPVPVWY